VVVKPDNSSIGFGSKSYASFYYEIVVLSHEI